MWRASRLWGVTLRSSTLRISRCTSSSGASATNAENMLALRRGLPSTLAPDALIALNELRRDPALDPARDPALDLDLDLDPRSSWSSLPLVSIPDGNATPPPAAAPDSAPPPTPRLRGGVRGPVDLWPLGSLEDRRGTVSKPSSDPLPLSPPPPPPPAREGVPVPVPRREGSFDRRRGAPSLPASYPVASVVPNLCADVRRVPKAENSPAVAASRASSAPRRENDSSRDADGRRMVFDEFPNISRTDDSAPCSDALRSAASSAASAAAARVCDRCCNTSWRTTCTPRQTRKR